MHGEYLSRVVAILSSVTLAFAFNILKGGFKLFLNELNIVCRFISYLHKKKSELLKSSLL